MNKNCCFVIKVALFIAEGGEGVDVLPLLSHVYPPQSCLARLPHHSSQLQNESKTTKSFSLAHILAKRNSLKFAHSLKKNIHGNLQSLVYFFQESCYLILFIFH
ncbi:hypothetical protein ACKWTF_014888 [Chironomus riparius]